MKKVKITIREYIYCDSKVLVVILCIKMVFTQSQIADIKTIIQETIRELMMDKAFIADIVMKVKDKLDIPKLIDSKCMEFKEQIALLHDENKHLQERVEKQEQFSRRNNVRIYGISEASESRQEILKMLNNSSRLEFSPEKIETVYHIGKKTTAGQRAVFLKFREYRYKEEIMSARKLLRGTNVIICDDLTKERHAILKEAVFKLGKKNVWCIGGKIHFKKGNTKYVINNRDDISRHTT